MHTQHIRKTRFGSATFHPPHIFAKAKKKSNYFMYSVFFCFLCRKEREVLWTFDENIHTLAPSHSPHHPSCTVLFPSLQIFSFLFFFATVCKKKKKNNFSFPLSSSALEILAPYFLFALKFFFPTSEGCEEEHWLQFVFSCALLEKFHPIKLKLGIIYMDLACLIAGLGW